MSAPAKMAARDVRSGESWAFPEHRSLAEVETPRAAGAACAIPGCTGRVKYDGGRYCSRACLAKARADNHHVKSRPPSVASDAEAVAPAGSWRIYFAEKPTRSAASLAEAKEIAAREYHLRYVEIADLATGQHLIRLNGQWRETKPAGTPMLFLGAA